MSTKPLRIRVAPDSIHEILMVFRDLLTKEQIEEIRTRNRGFTIVMPGQAKGIHLVWDEDLAPQSKSTKLT